MWCSWAQNNCTIYATSSCSVDGMVVKKFNLFFFFLSIAFWDALIHSGRHLLHMQTIYLYIHCDCKLFSACFSMFEMLSKVNICLAWCCIWQFGCQQMNSYRLSVDCISFGSKDLTCGVTFFMSLYAICGVTFFMSLFGHHLWRKDHIEARVL